MSQTKLQKAVIRKQMRRARRSLSHADQIRASKNLFRSLKLSGLLLKHQHIALYIGSDGELDPWYFADQLTAIGKRCYLPVISPSKEVSMHFRYATPDSYLKNNRYGIAEPDLKHSTAIPNPLLSLVLMPLVAFDSQGNRLGMGGGYYDRTFQTRPDQDKSLTRQAKLVGIAHDFQRLEALPTEPWDIPLDMVLTDQAIYRFK